MRQAIRDVLQSDLAENLGSGIAGGLLVGTVKSLSGSAEELTLGIFAENLVNGGLSGFLAMSACYVLCKAHDAYHGRSIKPYLSI